MRFAVLMFLCLIAVISYVQRTGINSVKKPICDDIGIDTEKFGMLGSAWLVGYAIMQVPGGWLADRFGGRIVLASLALLWSILTGLLGWCGNFEIMLALWFVMGLALAGIFPCAAKSIGAWFPDTEKAMASGLLGSSTMLGLAAASFLSACSFVGSSIHSSVLIRSASASFKLLTSSSARAFASGGKLNATYNLPSASPIV